MSQQSLEIETRLQALVRDRLFTPHFQPIIDLRRGTIAGYECLTRPSPDSGFARPDELFNAAESCGMVWPVESATQLAALRGYSERIDSGLVFVNCSPSLLLDSRFVASIESVMDCSPAMTPARVVFEITERGDPGQDEALRARCRQLMGLGFQIAIDDVGAGTSGLNRIMRLRPGWLKLDRDLIAEIDGDPVRENLVRFMLQFSKLSGVRLIAEGIERREELDRLIAIGVAYGQGYLFGRPAAVPGVDQEELDQLRAKISDTSSSRVLSALGDVIGPMSRPCCVADPNSTIGEAAAALRSSPGACGMLVECAAGSHWIDRETTEREADAGRKEEKLVRLGEPTGVPIDASTPLADALQMLASRQLPISTPLPVLRGDQVIGVVNPTDVLFRSALEMRTVRSRRSPLTGLPGRVACEELMQRHFLNRAEGVGIIFADLRNFSEFNETFGFDLGDDVVRELVASVAEGFDDLGTVPETAFVGHQGDDRLIIVGSNDCIERLAPRIVARFRDRLAPVLRSAIVARDERRALPAVGVRLLIEDDAFLHHRNARELVKTERLLRRLADEQITRAPNAPGWVVRRPAEDGELAAA